MVDGGFGLKAEEAKKASGKFGEASNQMEEARKALFRVLDAEGECWGNDESGQAFSKDYKPAVTGVRDAFGKLVTGIKAFETNVKGASSNHQNIDHKSGQNITKAGGK
ncbi:hypothetical protein EV193_10323 [Herbihabitans rhizosphaerae]|uniref:WXG100 family type VII secretion target n=1 Tax=Herbihabitans rhizosphaerae TaxID=1872711 RepID=A0A4Q7KYG5_9PSEU|nr:WXG100 family type VII secretion target [Herbihabitans rhizosphaerae]RZS40712.1 hypothetical protein EV193_10323 [Herbihabitans rhizosphaerae]